MRNLNAKQKKMLTEMVDKGITLTWDMTNEQYETIYQVNPHECFGSNADRYMTDIFFERKYRNAN
jgi:hypothetical protein